MMGFLRKFYDWLLSLFWSQELEITMLGLQNAGKTSLLRVLAGGEFTIEYVCDQDAGPSRVPKQKASVNDFADHSYSSIPTLGFNMKRVTKGHVTLKCWDLGGQPRFRGMWERYCRGVNAIVFIVDSADKAAFPTAAYELHDLLEKESVEGIPLLVLGNKSDLPDHATTDEIIEALNLNSITHREVSCYGISAKEETNLDAVLRWLIARGQK